jgi:hypothetical protein
MEQPTALPPAQPSEDPGRLPLPTGHAVPWSLLMAGSCLEGMPWPGYGTSGWDCPCRRGDL